MAIETSDGILLPGVMQNRLHMCKLTIDQSRVANSGDQPKYVVRVGYVKYGQDAQGDRYYDEISGMQGLMDLDYLALAMQDAAVGNTTLLDALAAVQAAVARLYEIKTGSVATVV